jgi:hypothetical protein
MKRLPLHAPRWLHNPIIELALVGVLTWLAYLDLTQTYPLKALVDKYPLTDFGRANNWSQWTLADFLLSIMGAFFLYLIASRIVSRHSQDLRLLGVVIAFAILFAITLLAMYPIAATDIFEYVFHSRILVHYGQNPLAVPPMAFKGDPFLKTVNWQRHPSPYGPVWVLLTVPGSLIAGDDLVLNLVLMNALAVIFFLGCVLMIAAILRHKNPGQQVVGTLLFAWNPLVLFEAPGNGHNGIIMMFFALVALYFLVRRRWLWVIPALVASVMVKYITALLLVPFLIYCWRAQSDRAARVRYLVKTTAITTLFVGVVILPFLQVPQGLLEEVNFFSALAVPSLAYNLLRGIHGDNVAKVLTIAVCVILYLVLYALSVRTMAREQQFHRFTVLCTWLMVAYLGVACMHFQPWFAIWPIALGIWISHPLVRRVLVVFTASALLSYAANFVWVWNYRAWQTWQVNAMFVAVIFAPPLIVGLVSRLQAVRGMLARRRVVSAQT